jgi:ferredoxin-NADP reductase
VTAPQLLTWICVALLLQLVLGIGIAAIRHRGAAPGGPAADVHDAPVSPSGAWPGWRAFRVQAREFEDASRTQCSFYLEPVDGAPLPTFKPGQFLTFSLQLPDVEVELKGQVRAVTRCYSLSDRPDPARYRVTIKRVPPPAGLPDLPPGRSSNHFHDRVQLGDVLKVKAPSGHFFIDPDPKVPAVLVAGGIGITPMMSMLRWCLAEQPQRTVHLVYGVRNGGEQAFKPLLDELARANPLFRLTVAYSRPDPGDTLGVDYQHAGHVDIDLLKRTLPHGRHQFYVCGPSAMMETLVPALAEWGVPRQDIHYEAFGPASVRLPGAEPSEGSSALAAPVEVRFQRSGRTLEWDGQDANLLDFAERHGVSVESGCRSGGCGTCETKLVSGTVHYASPPDHDAAPGHCLLCVGKPASALVLAA